MCLLQGCDGHDRIRYALRRFDVCVCPSCGLMFRSPFPDADELRAMYDDPEYHDSPYFDDPLASEAWRHSPEVEIFSAALEWLRPLQDRSEKEKAFLLDIGCGNATFLRLARRAGWSVEGVELSEALSSQAASRFQIDVKRGDFLSVDLDRSAYAVITMWDLLEHLTDPLAALRRARELLLPGGVLVILTIDSSSLFNLIGDIGYRLSFGRLQRPIELLYDARHNYYFSQRSLEWLLEQSGYRIQFRRQHRAHLGRWLSEPAAGWIRLGANAVDLLSQVVGRQYRQLLFCNPLA